MGRGLERLAEDQEVVSLPFTRDQFFDVFAAYNEHFGPAVVVLWLATACGFAALLLGWTVSGRVISLGLAAHWAWAGIAYHLVFFSKINRAAWLFSGLFLTEAILLGWYSRRVRFPFPRDRSLRHWVSQFLILYALAYPLLALVEGNNLPRSPTFGVPCPTAILTIGLLLTAESVPLAITIIPLLWAFIGGSAAFLLGVRTDLALLAAGVGLLTDVIISRTSGRAL
ncbi:MAG TPA: DUF6064 family protein [Terriglobia bacterium]|nr:DUF6064 family protein [Terriglobia bacterium]